MKINCKEINLESIISYKYFNFEFDRVNYLLALVIKFKIKWDTIKIIFLNPIAFLIYISLIHYPQLFFSLKIIAEEIFILFIFIFFIKINKYVLRFKD